MYLIAIVDDQMEDAQRLADLLSAQIEAEVRLYDSAQTLEEAVSCGAFPDVIFMDICLSDESDDSTGIDAVARLERLGFFGAVVYMSGYDSYHTSVYRTRHIGYLRKPFTERDVAETWQRVERHVARTLQMPLCLHVGGEDHVIHPFDIWFIESDLRRVRIHMRSDILEMYGKLGDVLNRLSDEFVRCHQSFAVNLRYVEHLGATDVELVDGRCVPVSRRRRQEVRDALFAYIRSGDGCARDDDGAWHGPAAEALSTECRG